MAKQFVIVLQGAAGSGKSTLAWILRSGIEYSHQALRTKIVSTDDYFIGEDGVYRYNPEMVAAAHRWNQNRCKILLTMGFVVIVDNTNIRRWEARPYVQMAIEMGLSVTFVRCMGEYANRHGVPDAIVRKMRSSMEHLTVESCLSALAPWEEPYDLWTI